jgi:pimeloyl-ACP methyl ester carboxylesterase
VQFSHRANEPLTAVTRGNGPIVVLVHGALGDYRQWEPIASMLEDRYQVVAISRRHHWPNPMPPVGTEYTYEGHRDDLVAFLRGFDAPVHLVGHSYGAGVALLSALAEPALVRSLVVIEPSFGNLLDASAPDLAPETASRRSLLEATQRLAGAGDHEGSARALIDWLQDSPAGFDRLAEPVRRGLLQNAATCGPTFAVPAPIVTCDMLQSLGTPVLVLHGSDTRRFFRRVAERVAACLPSAQIGAVPACGHMSIVENPAGVAGALAAFLGHN